MKNSLVCNVLFGLMFSVNLLAQDIIHIRTGHTIEAKVLEISPDEISYKKFANLEGPTYIMEKSKVEKIVFENGVLQTFSNDKPANKRYNDDDDKEEDLTITWVNGKYYFNSGNHRIMGKSRGRAFFMKTGNPELIDLVQKSKRMELWAYFTGFGSIPVAYVSVVGAAVVESAIPLVGLGVAVPLLVSSSVLKSASKKTMRTVVDIYNESLKNQKKYQDW